MSANLSSSLRSPKARAFTLLEVSLAMAMFAVLIGSVYSVLTSTLRLREKAYEAFEAELPRSFVVDKIRRDLANVVPPVGVIAGVFLGEQGSSRSNRSDKLLMHSTSGEVTENAPWGEIQRVEYYLAQPENPEDMYKRDCFDLVRATTRNLLSPNEVQPDQERLLREVRALTFQYYDGEYWEDEWDSTNSGNEAPAAVRVRIEFILTEEGLPKAAPIELITPIVVKAITIEQEDDSTATEPTDGGSGGGGGGGGGGAGGGAGGGPGGGGR